MRVLRRWGPWIAGGVIAATGAGVVLASRSEPPAPVEDLERVSQAGERVQSTSEDIVANLQRIIGNLEEGADFAEASAEIQDLTRRQERSLRDLAAILRDQLKSLQEAEKSIEGTRAAVTSLTRIGERQQALVDQALASLQRIEAFAEHASERSADFAWRARYGARLAEDSRDSFSGP